MPFCGICGREVREGVKFCPNCGSAIEELGAIIPENQPMRPPTPSLTPHGYVPHPVTTGRSAPITIASIIFYISGILELISSIITIAGGAILGSSSLLVTFGEIIGVIGLVFLLISILNIYVGKLLWDNKKNGGTAGIILGIIGIITGFFTLAIGVGWIDMILSAVVIILIAIGWNTLT